MLSIKKIFNDMEDGLCIHYLPKYDFSSYFGKNLVMTIIFLPLENVPY